MRSPKIKDEISGEVTNQPHKENLLDGGKLTSTLISFSCI